MQTVWSNDFTAGNSKFNAGATNTCQGGVIGVSSTIMLGGLPSGYYYGNSNPKAGTSCREYPSLNLNIKPYGSFQPLLNFHFEIWVYIHINAPALKGWLSFATFIDGPGNTFTIDGETNNRLGLWIGLANGIVVMQNVGTSSIKYFPFNQWFEISVDANIIPNTSASSIVVSQNGTPLIRYTGRLLNDGFRYAHFGLYMSNAQPSAAVYNAQILIQKTSP
jgi:hypothetical protein